MPHIAAQRLQHCADLPSALENILERGLELTGATLGNVQLMDWNGGWLEIAAQRGFDDEFLTFFRRVRAADGSACGRALRAGEPIVIEDVTADAEFAFCRNVMLRAGVRAVQSTPLISSSGALVGVLSTHFPVPHRPAVDQMGAVAALARLAATAIIQQRARGRIADEPGGDIASAIARSEQVIKATQMQVERSRAAVQRSEALLRRTEPRDNE